MASACCSAVHRRKVRRLFIDGLGAFQRQPAAEPGRMGNFLTALMNEMRVLGVTTVYTLEVPDSWDRRSGSPIGDLSSLAENLIMLRFVEVALPALSLGLASQGQGQPFDPSLHEYPP